MTGGGDTIDVLHVDDDPAQTEVAARFIERADHRIEVRTATEVEGALEALADGTFDCVVSDYDMPEIDGLEFFDAVRDSYPELPFILFTGKGNEEVAGEAVSAGVTDYLQKSSDTEQYELLANRITNAVRSSRTEQRLETERRRFRALFENFPEPTISYVFEAGEPHIVDVNEAFTGVFGYDESDVVGEPVNDLLVPPDRRAAAVRLDERVKNGDTIDSHIRRGTREGLRDFRFRNIQLPDDDRVDGYGIYADITERKRHERELRRRNDLFRQAQDLAHVGAWEYDRRTEALNWTEQVYEIHGVSTEFEPTLEAVREFYHPEDREAVSGAFEDATSEAEPFEFQARIDTDDGKRRWIQTHGRPEVDGGEVVRVRGAIQDVTDREERLAMIRQLQYRAQDLIREGDHELVAETAVDIATSVLDVPVAGVHLTDHERAVLDPVEITDAAADGLDEAPTYERNDPDRTVDRLMWGVLETGERAIVEDVREHDPVDESETPVRSGLVLPLDEHGVFFAAAHDPHALSQTDRYLADILATILTAALDRADHERELREQKRLLEARTDRLDELVSVISHDLRSPLNVADGRLDLARTDCDSRHLEDAASAVERSREIVDDLLTFAREGGRDAEPTAVTLPAIVQDCWRSVATGKATLRVETDRVVRADHDRLRHLLENLIRNAAEHAAEDDEPLTVTLGSLEDGFYVADDGVGVPPDDRQGVFESGFSTGESTGLGLSIVKQVVHEHGWTVDLSESDEGGARFEFTGVEFVDE